MLEQPDIVLPLPWTNMHPYWFCGGQQGKSFVSYDPRILQSNNGEEEEQREGLLVLQANSLQMFSGVREGMQNSFFRRHFLQLELMSSNLLTWLHIQ